MSNNKKPFLCRIFGCKIIIKKGTKHGDDSRIYYCKRCNEIKHTIGKVIIINMEDKLGKSSCRCPCHPENGYSGTANCAHCNPNDPFRSFPFYTCPSCKSPNIYTTESSFSCYGCNHFAYWGKFYNKNL